MLIAMVIVPGGNAVRGLLEDFYVYGVTIFIILREGDNYLLLLV